MGFDFEIQYRCGASNRVADAPSRIHNSIECSNLTLPQCRHWDTLKQELNYDTFLAKLREDISSQAKAHACFTIENGILFYKGQLVVPKTSQLIPVILEEFHYSPMGGTQGRRRLTDG